MPRTQPYQTRQGVDPSIQINVLEYLPDDRYIAALTRLRAAIAASRSLQAYDDTTPGNKSLSCSWGLCHDSALTWPDPQDHIFPLFFTRYGRIAALSSKDKLCPMDTRDTATVNGCFHTCRVFQASEKKPSPTQAETLALYDAKLKA